MQGTYVDIVKGVLYPTVTHVVSEKLVRFTGLKCLVQMLTLLSDWHSLEDEK